MTLAEILIDFSNPDPDIDLKLDCLIAPGIRFRLPPVNIPLGARLKLYFRISPLHSIKTSAWCWHGELPDDGWEMESHVEMAGEQAVWRNAGGVRIPLELESKAGFDTDARYRFESGLFDMRSDQRLWGAFFDRFILDRLAGSDYLRELDSKHLNPASVSFADNRNFNLLGVQRGKKIANRIQQHTCISGRTVLDLGCATGGPACGVSRSGAHVIGIDPDDVSIDLSRLRAKGEGCDVRLVRGSGFDLPFRSGSLDGVIMADVFEHVREPGKILDEIHRVLVPGGFLYISAPNRLSMETIRREPHYGLPGIALMPPRMAAWWVIRHKKTSSTYELFDIPTYWTLLRYFRKAGFSIDESVPFQEATDWIVSSEFRRRCVSAFQAIGMGRLAVNKYIARMILGTRQSDIEMMSYKE